MYFGTGRHLRFGAVVIPDHEVSEVYEKEYGVEDEYRSNFWTDAGIAGNDGSRFFLL